MAGVNYLGGRVASRRNVTRGLVVVPARSLPLQWSKAVGMWAKDWAVGNVYSRCPRARPAPFRRFVHMSIACRARSARPPVGCEVSRCCFTPRPA